MTEPERYLAVDLDVLRAIKALAGINEHSPITLHAVRLVLRVARIDEVSGQLVLGIRLVRDLNDDQPPDDDQHLGTV